MERLSLERLARLVDERPTPEEQRHLDTDPRLRRELEALKAQSRSLRNLPAMLPPPGGWHQLERALSSAGLIHSHSSAAVWRKWLQVAAALVLFIGGTAVGWVTSSSFGSQAANGDLAGFVQPATLDEATTLMERKESEYRQAWTAYQQFLQNAAWPPNRQDPARRLPLDVVGEMAQAGQSFENPATRLFYLRYVAAAAEIAVEASPADPFLNDVLVDILEKRDQVWRQISQDNWN